MREWSRCVLGASFLVCSLVEPASAQAPLGAAPAAQPESAVHVELHGARLERDGIKGQTGRLDAGLSVAFLEVFELAARLDARAYTLEAVEGGLGTARLGLGAFALSLGLGAGGPAGAAGIRVEGAASPRALGLESIGTGAPKYSLLVRPAFSAWCDGAGFGLGLYGGMVFDEGTGTTVGNYAAGGAFAVALGRRAATAHPLLGLEIDWTERVRPAIRARLGGSVESPALRLECSVVISVPGDPTGHAVGMELAVRHLL